MPQHFHGLFGLVFQLRLLEWSTYFQTNKSKQAIMSSSKSWRLSSWWRGFRNLSKPFLVLSARRFPNHCSCPMPRNIPCHPSYFHHNSQFHPSVPPSHQSFIILSFFIILCFFLTSALLLFLDLFKKINCKMGRPCYSAKHSRFQNFMLQWRNLVDKEGNTHKGLHRYQPQSTKHMAKHTSFFQE